MKNQLIEELILDEDSEIDFVELSSELEEWIINEPEEIPQHIIDENRADLIKERRKELAQMEMYDDPYMNWSGHR